MSKLFELQPAVKKETRNVIITTAIGVAIMFLVFFILHLIFPEDVPFDYTVFLGGGCAYAVAILNFFLLCLTVQKVASMTDRDAAAKVMRMSNSRRLILQCLWIVAVIFAPCFQLFAGILPILFPSWGIKIYGLFRKDLKAEKAALKAAEEAAAEADEAASDAAGTDGSTPVAEAPASGDDSHVN